MKVLLAGNQNCGKTTLFNRLTHNNAHAGNFPGVTVDILKGNLDGIDIYDLPGTYSLFGVSEEERLAAECIASDPDAIINIVDATTLARSLYFTLQLKETGIPMIVALNMIDEARDKGITIDFEGLERALEIKVIPICARTGENTDKIISSLKTLPQKEQKRAFLQKPSKLSREDDALRRYKEVDKLCENAHFPENKSIPFADKLLTGRFTAVPIFIIILALTVFLTFSVFGKFFCALISQIFDFFSVQTEKAFTFFGASDFLVRLVCDGILSGIGSIISFLPCVLLLSFFLSIMEDSGYMARVAFFMDSPMRKCGFSGKAIVSLVMGLGCSVPALLSCRTLEENRKNTALAVPFISCSARLPVYIFMASSFFRHPYIIIAALYVCGFICAFISGTVSSKNTAPPFLLELPPYRMPKLSSVFKDMLDKALDFLKRTFSVIFIASVTVWILANISFSLEFSQTNSILCVISKKLIPVFSPLGITDWKPIAALISGISAKEAILSTLSVLNAEKYLFSAPSALSFLFFVSLYTPCIASLALIRKEYGIKTELRSIIFQTLTAYAISFTVFTLSSLFLT